MFVCLCKAVTDREITTAVEQGVTSFDAMQNRLGVASVCGSCTCEVKEILNKKLQAEATRRAPLPVDSTAFA